MSGEQFRVAILDDYENIADTVPGYQKLTARADVSIVRYRLDSSEKIVEALGEFDALLLMRERTHLSEIEIRLANRTYQRAS